MLRWKEHQKGFYTAKTQTSHLVTFRTPLDIRLTLNAAPDSGAADTFIGRAMKEAAAAATGQKPVAPDPEPRLRTPRHQPGSYPVSDPSPSTNESEINGLSF